MTKDEFNKIFDEFEAEQKRLGYSMMTNGQASIIGQFVSYLENAGLLKKKNDDSQAYAKHAATIFTKPCYPQPQSRKNAKRAVFRRNA